MGSAARGQPEPEGPRLHVQVGAAVVEHVVGAEEGAEVVADGLLEAQVESMSPTLMSLSSAEPMLGAGYIGIQGASIVQGVVTARRYGCEL